MTNSNNIFSSEPVTVSGQIVEPGDVALLLKRDGSVQALTFGYDRARLSLPTEEHTEEDTFMLQQGAKLFALAFAAGHPKLMTTLMEIASDPNVIDFATIEALKTRH